MTHELITYSIDYAGDLEPIALVIERANARRDEMPEPRMWQVADTAEDLRLRLAKPGAWMQVAQIGQTVVGVALGYPKPETDNEPSETTEYLSMLFVDPGHWGKRIAGTLLDAVAASAKESNKQHLSLWTRHDDNEHARSVYEHKGFALTGLTRTSFHGRQIEYVLDL